MPFILGFFFPKKLESPNRATYCHVGRGIRPSRVPLPCRGFFIPFPSTVPPGSGRCVCVPTHARPVTPARHTHTDTAPSCTRTRTRPGQGPGRGGPQRDRSPSRAASSPIHACLPACHTGGSSSRCRSRGTKQSKAGVHIEPRHAPLLRIRLTSIGNARAFRDRTVATDLVVGGKNTIHSLKNTNEITEKNNVRRFTSPFLH
jgi:hypothetical protein